MMLFTVASFQSGERPHCHPPSSGRASERPRRDKGVDVLNTLPTRPDAPEQAFPWIAGPLLGHFRAVVTEKATPSLQEASIARGVLQPVR